jgi:putative Holliday junction resolvase
VADRRRLAELVGELEAVQVVVGLPLSLDGSRGPAARAVIEEVAALAAHIGVPVSTFDERLSTLEAQRRRRLADEPAPARGDRSSAPGRRRPAGARRRARAPLDAVAAAIILQAWLDAGPGSSAATP